MLPNNPIGTASPSEMYPYIFLAIIKSPKVRILNFALSITTSSLVLCRGSYPTQVC
jgi:hypothetical protein